MFKLITCILFFLFAIVETYSDITKKKFTTTVYIVISDIVGFLALFFVLYFCIIKENVSQEISWYVFMALIISQITTLVRKKCESKRFELDIKQNTP